MLRHSVVDLHTATSKTYQLEHIDIEGLSIYKNEVRHFTVK